MELARRKINVRNIAGVLMAVIGIALTSVIIVHVATFDPVKVTSISAQNNDEATFTYTAPGVITIMGDTPHVAITASPDAEIQWAYGSSDEVKAYVGKSVAQELRGFGQTMQEASVKVSKADDETAAKDKETIDAGGFALDQLDTWLKSGTANGKVEFDLDVEQGLDRSIIATTSDGKAPAVSLTWTEEEKTDSPAPFIVIGVLFTLIGLVLLLTDWREQSQRIAVAKAQQRSRDELTAQTSVMPAIVPLPYPDEERDERRKSTGATLGAGIVPGTLRAQEFRERELAEEERLIAADGAEPRGVNVGAGDGAAAGDAGAALATDGAADGHGVGASESSTLWSYTEPFEQDDSDDENAKYSTPVNDAWKGELHA